MQFQVVKILVRAIGIFVNDAHVWIKHSLPMFRDASAQVNIFEIQKNRSSNNPTD